MTQGKDILEQMFDSLMTSQQVSKDELRVYAEQQLSSTLAHAARTAPFYRKRLIGFEDQNVPFDHKRWQQVPILTRNDIKDRLDDIASNDVPPGHGELSFGGTSGTSGLSILTKRSHLVDLMQIALQNRFFANVKISRSFRLIQIKGNEGGNYPEGQMVEEPWLPSYVCNKTPAPVLSLGQPVNLEDQLEFINRQGRCYLNTQPSNFAGLALLMKERATEYPKIDIASVLTLGELVQPYHRELAKDVFNCNIIDQYSATEVGSIASQCAHGNLHVNSETLKVETLRDDDSCCDENEEGRIIITSTINWAMLLIRYDIGDRGSLSTNCSCGSSLPTLKLTVGRERNLFKFSDGTTVLGLVSLAKYHEFFPARQWQLAQTGNEEITLRYTSDQPESAHNFEMLTRNLRRHFNRPQMQLKFERNESMKLSATGKLQEAVREIAE